MNRRLYDAGGSPPLRWRNRIRPVREQQGMTLTELARESGMHTSNLSNLESHTREPTAGTLLRLARALGCTVDALIAVESEDGEAYRPFANEGEGQIVKYPGGQPFRWHPEGGNPRPGEQDREEESEERK